MNKNLFKTIISDILNDDFFTGYKFVSSVNTLVLRTGDEFISVELDHWRDYYDEACVIRPLYKRHFDILCKWFEKYSVRDLRFQRLDPHVMLGNDSFGQEEEISFNYDFSDYDEKYNLLIETLRTDLTQFAVEYATLNDYYNKIVLPRIIGKMEFPDAGAEWIFEYLTATYLLDRDNYLTLKNKVFCHAEWLLHHHELNVAKYYDRLDEIISYMENNVKL